MSCATLRGIVIAVHCIPTEVESGVEDFWVCADVALKERGYRLLVLSCVPFSNSSVSVINIPFELHKFPSQFNVAVEPTHIDPKKIKDTADWYRITHQQSAVGLWSADKFFRELLASTNPVAVVGWQSTNPVTRLLRGIVKEHDIPFWAAERGWIRGTLMFDLAENNFMSELQSSFALRRIEEKYHPPDATLSLLSNRSLNASTHNRYASSGAMTKEQFRNKHQIPEDGKVFAIFTHGEPSINTLLCPTVREIHGISEEILNFRIAEVCQELARRGFWVVVQEHPFNCKFGKTVKLPEYSRLIRTEENVSTVLNVADHYLFTLSTIQFDAVFLGKSFGLLCKSALFSNGAPWLFSDFESAGDFLDAIQDGVAWRSVQFKIQRRCAFLYDYFLLDIGPTKVKEAGEQFALQMATFSRQSKPDFPENFSRFVGKWITLGNVLPA